MTLGDFLKRVNESDLDKMLLWTDGIGWSNIDSKVEENDIYIYSDRGNSPFSSDK